MYEAVTLKYEDCTGILTYENNIIPLFDQDLFKNESRSAFCVNDVMSMAIVRALGHESVDTRLAVLKDGNKEEIGRLSKNILEQNQTYRRSKCFLPYSLNVGEVSDIDPLFKYGVQAFNLEQIHEGMQNMMGWYPEIVLDADFYKKDLERYLSTIVTMDADTSIEFNWDFIQTRMQNGLIHIAPFPIYDSESCDQGSADPLLIPKENLSYAERTFPCVLKQFGKGLKNLGNQLDKICDPRTAWEQEVRHRDYSKHKGIAIETLIRNRKGLEKQIPLLLNQLGMG